MYLGTTTVAVQSPEVAIEQQRMEDNRARDTAIFLGIVGALALGGYRWKGWKGAVGVPAGAAAAFVGFAFLFGNR